MLRRTLLASAGAIALTGAAFAADLSSRAPPPVFLPPPPVFTWTGFYIGINAGGHFGGSKTEFTGTDDDVFGLGTALDQGLIPQTGANGSSGFIGGGGFGYNYQINSFVLGLEVDFDGATGHSNLNTAFGANTGLLPVFFNGSQSLDWFGTLRGRLGWTPVDHLLIYGTGGLAFGNSVASFSVVQSTANPPLSDFASSSRSVGWTVGAGLEYALPNDWSNWSVKVEYLYYDLGNTTSTVVYSYPNADFSCLTCEFSSLTGQTRHNGSIVRAGLNYKFHWWVPAPVVAKY
jgi:outer membrane immunogenic protein